MSKNRSKSLCIFLSLLIIIVILQEVAAVVPGMPVTEDLGLNISNDQDSTLIITVIDFDEDGNLDVIAGNFGESRLYLSNGSDNPFGNVTGIIFPNGTGPKAFGDLDGDEDLDMVARIPSEGTGIFLNNGTEDPFANFNGLLLTDDTSFFSPIALGDVDGDGNLDIVARDSEATRLFLNNGTGDPFANVNGLPITDTDRLGPIALGDMDGDGDLDMVARAQSQAILLYLNNGTDDPFANVNGANLTDDLNDALSIALGDVDGDGDLDVVLGNDEEINRLYLNNGTGDPFADVAGVNITDDDDDTFSIKLGDMNGDNDLDIIAGNFQQPNRLYLNNGTENPFADVKGFNITDDANDTISIRVGDMDGDGDLDVIAANSRQPNRLYLNNGSEDPFADITGANITDHSDRTTSLAVGDMNGDGELDVIAGNWQHPNRLYLNNGTEDPFGDVTGVNINDDDDETQSIAPGDMDGDGDLDLVVGNFEGVNRLYLNNGTENPFANVTGIIIDNADETESIALGDMDGDGDLDLVVGADLGGNRLYLNNGTENPFEFVDRIFFEGANSFFVAVGDLNGDGSLDVVTHTTEGNFLLLNNSTGNPFANVMGLNLPEMTGTMALGDVNADGRLDIVSQNNDGTRLFLNNSTEDPFSEVAGLAITTAAGQKALGDINGDGDLDIALGRFGLTNRRHLINTESGATPEAPTNLSATVLSASSIELDWVDNSDDETGLRIDRKVDGESFSEIAEVEADTTSFTDNGLQAGIRYTYRVRAENSAGSSGYSNTVTATTETGLPTFPISLRGNDLPEQVTVEFIVSKSLKSVATARLILDVFDADKSNEGELFINGNGPIRLFGSLKSPQNNRTTARIAIKTPADWWQDGTNTLEFIHTQSGGYRVESGFVEFGATEISDFPIIMQGSELPEEAEIILTVSKPDEVSSTTTLNLTVFDADKLNEGFLTVNGNEAIPLFGKLRRPENNRSTVTLRIHNLPSDWWLDGDNILGFAHTKSGGYRVESATVDF